MTNLSLKLWINGTTFYILDGSGDFQIREFVPAYYTLPIQIFAMNEFNETKGIKVKATQTHVNCLTEEGMIDIIYTGIIYYEEIGE